MRGLKVMTTILVVLLAPGMLWVGSLPESARAASPAPFVNVSQPIGVAGGISFKGFPLGQSVWFVTQHCQGKNEARDLLQITQAGSTSVFARLNQAGDTSRQGCLEEYAASAPGLGSYALLDTTGNSARNFVYVTQGNSVVETPPVGLSLTTPPRKFAVISSLGNSGNGITFGRFESFDTLQNDMIVAGTVVGGTTGEVWRVRRELSGSICAGMGLMAPCGVANLIGTVPAPIIGDPAVTPPTFVKCPGGVLVASPTHMGGAVFCVTAGPAGAPVGLFPGAGGVHFIFASSFTCGPSGTNRYFVTSIFKQNGNLTQFPSTDFTSPPLPAADRLDGTSALVMSRTGAGIGKLTPTSPAPPALLQTFQSPIGDHRGSGVCGREYGVIDIGHADNQGMVTIKVLSRAPSGFDTGFFPQTRINVATCKFGKFGFENSIVNANFPGVDSNKDGIPELVLKAVGSLTGFGPGEDVNRGILTCLLNPQSPDEGFAGGE